MINGTMTELNRGIFTEILTQLRKFNAVNKTDTVFNEEYLKLVLNRMAIESGVYLLFHAYMTRVPAGLCRFAHRLGRRQVQLRRF